MKIAFLGNLRFIGRAAAERAVACGHEVTIVHTGKYAPSVEGATYQVAPRDAPAALRAILEPCHAEVIVDCYAMTRHDATCALEAFCGAVKRVVVLSSQDVYAQFGSLLGHECKHIADVVSEESPLTIPYPFRNIADHAGGAEYDKKQVEDAYREAEGSFDSITTLRLPATYGHYDKTRRFAWILDRLDEGLVEMPHIGGANWRWTHGHVGDVADAILLAATHRDSGHGTYNVGELSTPTMRERVDLLACRTGVRIHWIEVDALPESLEYLGPMPNDFVVDTHCIREKLGLHEISTPEQRADDLIKWLRSSRT